MTRCDVCCQTSTAVRELVLTSGQRAGWACRGECLGLLWEAHFVRAIGAPRHELQEVAWAWRRRRAKAEGRPFLEQRPASPAERTIDEWIAREGLEFVAREME